MYFGKGNRKLNKRVLIWNLPRLISCPGAGDCRDWCYEIKTERMYPNCVKSRDLNLIESIGSDFEYKVVGLLNQYKERDVRIHEAGDFYSQNYLDKWKRIATNLPTHNFFAFTKSLHYDLWTGKPDNFNILQSIGGRYNHLVDWGKPTARVAFDGKPTYMEEICTLSNVRNGGCGRDCRMCIEDRDLHIVWLVH